MNARRVTIYCVSALSLGLLGLAWWLTPDVVEQRLAADGTINDATRAQVALFRVGLCVLALLLPLGVAVLWRLKGPLARDLRISRMRHMQPPGEEQPSTRALMGRLPWQRLGLLLWFVLPAWYALVEATFHHRIQWPQCFQTELGIMENTIVALYLSAAVSALTMFLRRQGAFRPTGVHRWWILALGMFCLFVALEETNWGQVYFNFATPELIKRVNYQGDFSLHNLRLPAALPGKQTYWANALSQWLAVALAVTPSLLWISARLRRFVWRWEIPIPPLLAQAYCAAGALMPSETMRFTTSELPDSMMLPSEMREFSIAVAFAVWLLAERKRFRLYRTVGLVPPAIDPLATTARLLRQAAG